MSARKKSSDEAGVFATTIIVFAISIFIVAAIGDDPNAWWSRGLKAVGIFTAILSAMAMFGCIVGGDDE